MTERPCALVAAIALALTLGTKAMADPPKINDIRPLGVQRGAPIDLTINGSGLAIGSPSLIAPFPFTATTDPKSDGGNFRLKVEVSPSVAAGVYPVRVKTDEGLSNPFLLAVGQVPQVTESEDNSTFEQAQAVASPVVVEGQCAGSDVDFFKFPGKKGQRIVVDAQCARIGSGVDPQIRLTTAGRKFLEAADDTPGLLTDARLSAVLPEDGEYVVEISDSKYQGGGRPIYRLLIGPVPVAAEVFPIGARRGETVGFEVRGGTLPEVKAIASTIAPGLYADQFHPKLPNGDGLDVEIPAALNVSDVPELREPADPAAPPTKGVAPMVFNGRIDPAGDEDRFVLAVTPGQTLRIRVDASEQGSALDGTLQILGPTGAVLATAEDTVVPAVAPKGQKKPPGVTSPDPSIDFAVPAGVTEITLALRDLIGRGGVGFPYRINVEPASAAFEVMLNEAQLNVPKGGTAAVGVTIQRQGYAGPVILSIADMPAGLSMRPLTIAAGQAAGVFTVSATKEASFGPIDLKVLGTGQGPGGPVTDLASKLIIFAQQGVAPAILPTNTFNQKGLPAATALALPGVIESPTTPVEVVHGFGGSVPVKLIRAEKADGVLTFALLPLPAGMTVGGTIAEKAAEGAATINAAPEVPLGPAVVVLTAKGKLGGKDVTLVVPAVNIEVVRPASVTLAAPAIEIKAGATVEVKGTIVRKAAFKEPVKVSLTALPAGLKAEPVTVAPEAVEFTIKVQADAGAAAAMANAQVTIAFQINKKDYPTPPTGLAVKVVK
ncbi:MAG: hypothetical protein JWN86_626 [Planctomycetota bacterium]|nr:hypothetical protein [Planctomycetota bacterium]